jgi:hypothetical protein
MKNLSTQLDCVERENLMKRYQPRISMSFMALALVGLTGITGLANPRPRPFHLVEHGKVQVRPRDTTGDIRDLVSDGAGTATQLGFFTSHREAVLSAQTPGGQVFNFQGAITLTTATGDQLFASITGTVDFSTGHADLIYQFTGGTKGSKFENASGTTFWSVDVAKGEYDAVAEGQIILD